MQKIQKICPIPLHSPTKLIPGKSILLELTQTGGSLLGGLLLRGCVWCCATQRCSKVQILEQYWGHCNLGIQRTMFKMPSQHNEMTKIHLLLLLAIHWSPGAFNVHIFSHASTKTVGVLYLYWAFAWWLSSFLCLYLLVGKSDKNLCKLQNQWEKTNTQTVPTNTLRWKFSSHFSLTCLSSPLCPFYQHRSTPPGNWQKQEHIILFVEKTPDHPKNYYILQRRCANIIYRWRLEV